MAKLLTLINVMIMPKNYCVYINEYLHSDEIKCKCELSTCHYTIVSQHTIDAFYRMRLAFGQPLKVNSFYRCQSHNESVGGSKTSSHTTGLAVDVPTKNLSVGDKAKLLKIAQSNFDFVKVYDTFIHCQINPEPKVFSNG